MRKILLLKIILLLSLGMISIPLPAPAESTGPELYAFSGLFKKYKERVKEGESEPGGEETPGPNPPPASEPGPAQQPDSRPGKPQVKTEQIPAGEKEKESESAVENERNSPSSVNPVSTENGAEEVRTESSDSGGMEEDAKGISFYFDDADVYEVINTVFGEILKVNYIIDPKVSGRVNFRTTTPIPRNEVLPVIQIILRLNGIGVVEDNNLYRIVLLPEVSKEPAPVRFGRNAGDVPVRGLSLVQIIPLEYVESKELVRILTPLLTPGGFIMDIPSRNYLMVTDTDSNMRRLLQVVSIFDREDVQAVSKPKVFVYDLQNAKADHVAEILQKIFLGGSRSSKVSRPAVSRKPVKGDKKTALTKPRVPAVTSAGSFDEPLVAPGTKIFGDEITNSIIILSTPKDYSLIEEVIKQMDVMPRQVLIEVLVAEIRLTGELKFGLEWYLRSHFTLDNTKLTGINAFGESVASFDATDVLKQTGFSFALIDTAEVVRGLLQTLATDSKAKIISSPHIMVSDNREARIQVGDQVPVETGTSVTSGGETVTTIQYRDTGSVLKVKPFINEGGLVTLELKQEFSLVSSEKGVGDNPIFSTRTAETNVVVKNGQTIIIGGLIREDTRSSNNGIPILKDIPILGYLFGASDSSTDRTELVVLITPHVMSTVNEATKVTDEFIRKLKGLKDLKGSDTGSREEVLPAED